MNVQHPSNYHIIINDNIAHEFRSAGLAWDWYNSLTRGKVEDTIKLVRDGVVIAANDRDYGNTIPDGPGFITNTDGDII